MNLQDAIKSIFISLDIWLATSIAIITAFLLPQNIPYETGRSIFEVGISLLSVIFSVFFAALAILVTAGDNEFVRFLEEDGSYRKIIWTFRVTLLLLFVALLTAIALFIFTVTRPQNTTPNDLPTVYVVGFSFITLYALFSAVNSTVDAIRYAEFRARYLRATKIKD